MHFFLRQMHEAPRRVNVSCSNTTVASLGLEEGERAVAHGKILNAADILIETLVSGTTVFVLPADAGLETVIEAIACDAGQHTVVDENEEEWEQFLAECPMEDDGVTPMVTCLEDGKKKKKKKRKAEATVPSAERDGAQVKADRKKGRSRADKNAAKRRWKTDHPEAEDAKATLHGEAATATAGDLAAPPPPAPPQGWVGPYWIGREVINQRARAAYYKTLAFGLLGHGEAC